jgi:hypothetical protein
VAGVATSAEEAVVEAAPVAAGAVVADRTLC